MKAFFQMVWERVIVHWVPTLIGLAAGVGVLVLEQVTNWTATLHLPSWAAQAVAAALALIGAWLKGKVQEPPTAP